MATLAVIRAALVGKTRAVLWQRGVPDVDLCSQIAAEFPNCFIDWVYCTDIHAVQAALKHPAAATLNPRGISLYPFSPKQHWWLVAAADKHRLDQHFPCDQQDTVSNPILAPGHGHYPQKAWFTLPAVVPVQHVCIVGGGIAAAATAYALAKRGVSVSVITDGETASAASGNRQGLLYAKISPHDTVQSRLLLQAYGFSSGLLRAVLPDQKEWSPCGVLHLDDSEGEIRRNRALAAQACSLYQYLDSTQATAQAGIELATGGLWWPYGAWVHPPAFVRALLHHPLIAVSEQTLIEKLHHDGTGWKLNAQNGKVFSGSHVVLCCGAEHALYRNLGIHLNSIRGQTDNATAGIYSGSLKIALSGESYISPAWQGVHCFGATFHPNDCDPGVRVADSRENRHNLTRLHSRLTASLSSELLPAHAAVRCDAYDHLPVVGAVGDAVMMRQTYAKLALDKNYRINTPCPYLPQLYLNTAHGSRGLLSAPLCGEVVAAEILGLPHPLDYQLRAALSPNRLIIRDLVHRITNR